MLKLDNEDQVEPTLEVYGISAHVRDYRICWALNNTLGISLERAADKVVERGGVERRFTRFEFAAEEGEVIYSLIQNIGSDGLVVPDLKHADYLFVVQYAEDIPMRSHYSDIQRTEFVNAVFSLDPVKRKDLYTVLGVDGY